MNHPYMIAIDLDDENTFGLINAKISSVALVKFNEIFTIFYWWLSSRRSVLFFNRVSEKNMKILTLGDYFGSDCCLVVDTIRAVRRWY